ncbi:hypothetical protein B0H14DRAFT_3487240 [Mycena olivaceomarginata]|nr:hypothetical protein B0H14DRAFT_3487240 [Mycena olivaceomarginata]
MSFNPGNTLGSLEVGVLTSYVLLGVTITRTYIYYSRFPQDPRKLKALVALRLRDRAWTVYVWTISDYMHPESIFNFSPQSLVTTVFFSSLIAACVQGFWLIKAIWTYIASGNSKRVYDLISRHFLPPLPAWAIAPSVQVPPKFQCASNAVNTSSHNILLALVDWVEGGDAPDTIIGTADNGATSPPPGVDGADTTEQVGDGQGGLGVFNGVWPWFPLPYAHPTPHSITHNMRFLAHAHLVALGLLSLGITAYAQQCSQDTDCADNECCGLGVRSLDSLGHARNYG